MEAKALKLEIDDEVKEVNCKKGTDHNYGARPLRRTIQNLLEDKIAEAILDGKISKDKEVKIGLNKDGEIEIK